MNHDTGAILVLSGPSGAGKSSLIKKIENEIGAYYFSISTTTRSIREGEEEGVHYYFVDKKQFEEDIEEENFLEYARVHGNYYGTSIKPVKKALKQGKLVIFDIDVQGHDAVQKRLADITTSVFVTTPTLCELKQRLNARGTDAQEIIDGRIQMAKREVQRISEYDYLVINDDLDEAAAVLVNIAKAARMKIPSIKINEFVLNWEDIC